MSEGNKTLGLPEPQFRQLTELEDDAFGSGGPSSKRKRPPKMLTNKEEFEELLREHFGASKVQIDIDW